jgi:hypothetical protein
MFIYFCVCSYNAKRVHTIGASDGERISVSASGTVLEVSPLGESQYKRAGLFTADGQAEPEPMWGMKTQTYRDPVERVDCCTSF